MKSSSLFASPGAHVDSKLNSQLRRSSRVSSSNGSQLKASNRSLAVGEACAKAKDCAKGLCQAKEKKPFLTCCEVTFYSYKETYYFPRYKNNLQFLTILPAVLHESKAKQPAGCVLRADWIPGCCRWWAPAKHHCTLRELFLPARLSKGCLYSLDTSQD